MPDKNKPNMKNDATTKGLLVVIAILLGIIAIGRVSSTAEAQVDGSAGCGSASNPC